MSRCHVNALATPLFWAKIAWGASRPDFWRDCRKTMATRSTIFCGFLALSMIVAVACGATEQPASGGSQESGGGMAASETAVADHPTPAAEAAATAMPEPSPAAAGVTAESTDTTAATAATVAESTAAATAAAESTAAVDPTDAPPAESLPPVGAGVGELAPSYSLTLFDGSTVSSEDLAKAGKPVFLFFTATW